MVVGPSSFVRELNDREYETSTDTQKSSPMRVERYRAPSIDEALSKVQKSLGPDAIVLKTRKIPTDGIMGAFGREEIEVTAATPDHDTNFHALLEDRRQSEVPDPNGNGRPPVRDRADTGALQNEIRELRAAIEGIQGTVETIGDRVRYGDPSGLPPAPRELQTCLLRDGVSPKRAQELLDEVRGQLAEDELEDRASVRESLLRAIASRFRSDRPAPSTAQDRPFVIAFLGPTGAGKTTSLEKLALHLKTEEGSKVAIICCDTCRLGASKELEMFGERLNVPVETAYAPEEMTDILGRHAKKDVVLIDTAGRGTTAPDVLQEIEEFIRRAGSDEIHLVLSATTKSEDLLGALRRFERVSPSHLLFTKLDETASCGALLNVAIETEIPISYVTSSPGIAEAIEPLDPMGMARRILSTEREDS